jgi:hypothetical protein
MAKASELDDLKFSDPREEEEGAIDHIPKDERHLRTQAYDMSISDIVGKISSGDIVLDPDYQRNYVWDDKRASLLVESILLNVPIPVIYVAEDEDSLWDVVDGLQRLNSLSRFFANEFKLKGLDVLDELNGQFYKDLNPKAARILRNGILRIILIFKESNQDIKYEIFMRLNRGAVKLTEQELRNCLYRGPFNDMLHDLCAQGLVQTLLDLDAPHNRMADAELLLRHFTVKGGYDPAIGKISTYSGNMRSSLNHYMARVRNTKPEEIQALKKDFLLNALKVAEVFGADAFHRINPDGSFDDRLNRAIMDAVMVGVGLHSFNAIKAKKAEIKTVLQKLINEDVQFADAITTRTSDKQRMEYRVHTFKRKLDEVMQG